MTAPTDTTTAPAEVLSPDEIEARAVEFVGRDVKLVTITLRPKDGDDGPNEPIEGELQTAAEGIGFMFRKRGRQDADLMPFESVSHIAELARKPKQLRAKVLKPVTIDTAREHLVDRHGLELPQVNDWSPTTALHYHDQVDHSKLGHTHSTTTAASEDSPTS